MRWYNDRYRESFFRGRHARLIPIFLDNGVVPCALALWFMKSPGKESLQTNFPFERRGERRHEGEMPESIGIDMMSEFPETPWFVVPSKMYDARIADGLDGLLNSVHSCYWRIAVDGVVEIPFLRKKDRIITMDQIEQGLVKIREFALMCL